MERGAIKYSPADLPFPCALIRLPWPQNVRIARIVPPKNNDNKHTTSFSYYEDYINKTFVEELCSDPPLYSIRFGLNDVESFDTFTRIFSAEQVMSIQHFLSISSNNTFLSSARYTIIQANPEDSVMLFHKIFLVHHILESFDCQPIPYHLIEQLWKEKLHDRIIEFLANNTSLVHLIVFIDASKACKMWSPEYMAYVIYLNSQIVSVVSSCFPLKLCSPKGLLTFQIIVLPCSAFSEGVMILRKQSEQKIETKTCQTQKNNWWSCSNDKEIEELANYIPFSPAPSTNVVKYVGLNVDISKMEMRHAKEHLYNQINMNQKYNTNIDTNNCYEKLPYVSLVNSTTRNNKKESSSIENNPNNRCTLSNSSPSVSNSTENQAIYSSKLGFEQELCRQHQNNLRYIQKGLKEQKISHDTYGQFMFNSPLQNIKSNINTINQNQPHNMCNLSQCGRKTSQYLEKNSKINDNLNDNETRQIKYVYQFSTEKNNNSAIKLPTTNMNYIPYNNSADLVVPKTSVVYITDSNKKYEQ